jgi:cysteinyl-tRNA synthetase
VFGRKSIDFHFGGCDLKFPHHENEISLCESLIKSKWCPLFIHCEHVLNGLNGEKMSKSLNNSISLKVKNCI